MKYLMWQTKYSVDQGWPIDLAEYENNPDKQTFESVLKYLQRDYGLYVGDRQTIDWANHPMTYHDLYERKEDQLIYVGTILEATA